MRECVLWHYCCWCSSFSSPSCGVDTVMASIALTRASASNLNWPFPCGSCASTSTTRIPRFSSSFPSTEGWYTRPPLGTSRWVMYLQGGWCSSYVELDEDNDVLPDLSLLLLLVILVLLLLLFCDCFLFRDEHTASTQSMAVYPWISRSCQPFRSKIFFYFFCLCDFPNPKISQRRKKKEKYIRSVWSHCSLMCVCVCVWMSLIHF